ncbi:hypothetical protein DENSPDRAFT_713679 [Dentipellis sp. KUC8613]|nr:hypothetical protein DENSPDRAFT_713679 [Dentipellis sp. KUC8613]
MPTRFSAERGVVLMTGFRLASASDVEASASARIHPRAASRPCVAVQRGHASPNDGLLSVFLRITMASHVFLRPSDKAATDHCTRHPIILEPPSPLHNEPREKAPARPQSKFPSPTIAPDPSHHHRRHPKRHSLPPPR